MQQDIGWFDVSVDDASFVQVMQALQNHFYDGYGFFLVDFLLFLDESVEVSLVAELGYDVGVVLGLVDVVELHDVGTVDDFESFDFLLEEVAVDGVAEHFHVDDLDSDFALVGKVVALEDRGRVALADLVVEIVGVVLDDFLRLINCRHIRYPIVNYN